MVSIFTHKPSIVSNCIIAITIILLIQLPSFARFPVKITLNNSNAWEKALTQQEEKIGRKIKKVVIDAGHGGHDPGCSGNSAVEKELTLAIAMKTADAMKKKYPEIEVLLTRNTDVFIPLFRRIQYANEENADLFISIHCNFISNSNTKGTETFVMGLHRAEENLDVAKRENASILLESNFESNYDGYNPNSPEGHIIMSMYQNAYLDKSISFAADLEQSLKDRNYTKSRGVKQAGFAVLRRASMPAVLIEAGFLSNEEEAKYLSSEDGQNQISMSILQAFDAFYDQQNKSIDAPEEVVKTPEVTSPLYGIQIAAIKEENSTIRPSIFEKIGTLSVVQSGSFYKYVIGKFKTKEEASKAKEALKKMGYSGAFIVDMSRL